ncbi:mesoderm induction early response protein 1-like [Anthonomus grandis grandis]|uniref:mesoderm induction early response protein 1-like n=1 Tax=Anthonomus grandis grandis TaxID=2921223 RepID=UPI002165B5E2|nr:mesoderm induction early response protein 1-like [Anthonomus grandis grandis]
MEIYRTSIAINSRSGYIKAKSSVSHLTNSGFSGELGLEEFGDSSSSSDMSSQNYSKLFFENENLDHDLPRKYEDKYPDASRLLRSKVIEEEEDRYHLKHSDEAAPMIMKTIMVGGDYQAVIPEGLSNYGDALPYENDDKLLWDPEPLDSEAIDDYLKQANSLCKGSLPNGKHVRDNEPALHLLQQCGHNVEEALRRLQINKHLYEDDNMQIWSEEECRNFEAGIRLFGKNFWMTQQNKVRTRSVGELVQFYYLWKKSERHDMFANKIRLEKKKYVLHPGVTDFMDRFLEDSSDFRDRSSSPNVVNM